MYISLVFEWAVFFFCCLCMLLLIRFLRAFLSFRFSSCFPVLSVSVLKTTAVFSLYRSSNFSLRKIFCLSLSSLREREREREREIEKELKSISFSIPYFFVQDICLWDMKSEETSFTTTRTTRETLTIDPQDRRVSNLNRLIGNMTRVVSCMRNFNRFDGQDWIIDVGFNSDASTWLLTTVNLSSIICPVKCQWRFPWTKQTVEGSVEKRSERHKKIQ